MKKKTAKNSSSGKQDFLVVGLGASAGGIKALQEFFATMPPNSGMAFVVILHLSPEHESNLANILQTQTTMPVVQVTETHKVAPDHVYVIPPNNNLEMFDGVVRLAKPEKQPGNRVAIDIFFRTLAEAYTRNAVCVVLSGTGSDGTLGLKRIKESNGFAVVQEPADAEFEEMPRSAIATGLADWVLPVAQMPEKLLSFKESSERLHLTNGADAQKIAAEINAEESLREILTLLRVRTGHDFSNYKTPTLIRRIARHLQIHELEDIPTYLAFLREKPEEIISLQRNLLINVTNFFRDKEAFDALEREVIPNLFLSKSSRDTIRVWCAGCASGEEAYSLAILLHEYAETLTDPPRFQIFATDVDDEAIAQAREHLYPETISTDVSEERLRKFFVREGTRYRVRKELREMVLFAPHNVLRDPPFFKLDLITCRNLLIYLNRDTQERLMEVFHFALNLNGYLFLGTSETAENVPQLFTIVDKKNRLYSRRAAHHANLAPPRMPLVGQWQISLPDNIKKTTDKSFALGEVHFKLLEKIAPPSILVNHEFDVMYMSEEAGRFLKFKGGEPSRSILKLVNQDLLPDLRAALFTAQRERRNCEFLNIAAQINGEETIVNLLVRPVDIENDGRDFLLVIFDETGARKTASGKTKTAVQTEKIAARQQSDAMESIVERLEADLRRTKENLRATVEQHEISIEELKASNEELQAINEELRSASEELETSKEEAQSVNEELTTVNHELKEKIDEATRINSDLQNLIASTDIATIFLDKSLRIKRYTPRVEEFFNLTLADSGRPLAHFTSRLKYDDLAADAKEVLRTLKPIEREISDDKGRHFLTRFAPYRTLDDRIDGVVLNFINVTDRKRAENLLRENEEMFRAFLTASSDVVYSMSADWSEMRFLEGKEFLPDTDNPNDNWLEKYIPEEDKTRVQTAIDAAIQSKSIFELEHRVIRADGEIGWTHSRAVPMLDEDGEIKSWFGSARDITGRKNADELLRKSEEELQLILESTKDFAIITFDLEGHITRWNEGAQRIFGWTEAEAVGQLSHLVFTPADRAIGIPEREMKNALERGRAEDERWHIRKDGSRFFASGVMQPLKDGAVQGFVKITRDQTEKMQAEQVLREKAMLQQFVVTQENERRRIARDLHDHLGQQLTALRLKLDAIKKSGGDDEKLRGQVADAIEIAARLDADVDFIAWELRPAALDELGLLVTLNNFIREWSSHTGIAVEFHSTGLSRVNIASEIETNLYRIAQEALNNVYKHAEAKTVSLLLERRKDKIVLIVEDDGAGFDTEDKTNRTKGIGLTGMAERARILGGDFEIESNKGKGTTVYARVPLAKKTEKE